MSERYSGFDFNKERADQRGDEWRFGSLSQPGIAQIPEELRDIYLPAGELQYGKEDFSDCASRSPHNHLEAQLNYLYINNLLTYENKRWFEDQGYVNGSGYIELSDRFTAILSGTTRQGNSLKAPLESIRKNGVIPKSMLPAHPSMTFDQYHDASKITKAMRDLGIEFTRRFTVNYEQVHRSQISKALEKDMIGVAGYAWPSKKNGVYPKTDETINHAFLLFGKPDFEAFDNYTEGINDFTKTLAPDYVFWEYGYRIFISKETTYAQQLSLWQQLLDTLKRLFEVKKEQVAPKPEPKPAPANNVLNELILAMRRHEGWFPGSRSQRNNNPLNCRYSSVGYHSMYGEVKRDPQNFAIFSTYELGHLYAKNLILQKARKHPDWNLVQFIGDEREGWAPASDNNDVDRYATVLAEALGVSKTAWKLKNLLS
jgi:hypothetical protein